MRDGVPAKLTPALSYNAAPGYQTETDPEFILCYSAVLLPE